MRLNAPTMLKPNGFSFRSSRVVCFSSVQSLSHVQLFATPTTTAHQASLSITNSQSLLRLMFIESVMPSNHLILCCPCLLLPSIFPSTRVFSNESVLRIRWPEYWNFSFSISPSNEYSGLISFQINWFDLLVVQGTLKSLLQHHNFEFLKASILRRAAFFMVQLSHPYMTTQEILPEYLPNVKHRSLLLGLQRGKQRTPAQNCGWINRYTMNHSAG